VSVEMFEHVRNHRVLTERIASWLRPGGKLFVHVFAHRSDAYPFETGSRADWMARHFFTGGLMPSDDLLLQRPRARGRGPLGGVRPTTPAPCGPGSTGSTPTATGCAAVRRRLRRAGPPRAAPGYHRWRVFTIACEELFAFDGGDEWHVSHYRFVRPTDGASAERAVVTSDVRPTRRMVTEDLLE
jgi:cyclopropane-fatty-acyl-phospholipid synthase